MAKIPESPLDIVGEFTSELTQIYGKDLLSIAMYGSGAIGEYVYKKSDINFLVVLTEHGIQDLAKSFDFVKNWKKRNVAVPLFVTESYIQSSLDSFPIEFLSMKQQHKHISGHDYLDEIEIDPKDLRLQCEARIKGNLLHLRSEFLLTLGQKKNLEALLGRTIPSFISLFTAMLFLKGIEPPKNKHNIFAETCKAFELDRLIFEKILAIREKTLKLPEEKLLQLTEDYIQEIRKLAAIIDQW